MLSAAVIAALHKKRWSVELFFKWTKHNSGLPSTCSAASIKKETALEISLYTFLQIYPFILSRKSNWNVFLEVEANYAPSPSANQLKLFDN